MAETPTLPARYANGRFGPAIPGGRRAQQDIAQCCSSRTTPRGTIRRRRPRPTASTVI